MAWWFFTKAPMNMRLFTFSPWHQCICRNMSTMTNFRGSVHHEDSFGYEWNTLLISFSLSKALHSPPPPPTNQCVGNQSQCTGYSPAHLCGHKTADHTQFRARQESDHVYIITKIFHQSMIFILILWHPYLCSNERNSLLWIFFSIFRLFAWHIFELISCVDALRIHTKLCCRWVGGVLFKYQISYINHDIMVCRLIQ